MESYKFEEMKENEADAKAAYNELMSLGARPSRPIREEFAFHTWSYNPGDPKHEGMVEWYDPEYDALGHAYEASLQSSHWLIERRLFQGQLQRWKEFRKAQETSKGDPNLRNRLLIRPAEFPPLESTDPILTQKLTTIQNWRAYRAYFQGKIAPLDSCRMAARDQVSQLRFTFVRLADGRAKDKLENKLLKEVFQLRNHHEAWLAGKALLCRVDGEIFKILEETVDELLVHNPPLFKEYEEHTAKLAEYFAEQLGTLSSSAWPLRSPPASLSAPERLHQWEREISRMSDLYYEWKESLECSRLNHDPTDHKVVCVLSPEPSVIRDGSLWERYVQSRQEQLVNAKKWQNCWEDVERFCIHEGAPQLGNFFPIGYLQSTRKEQGLAYVSIQEAAQALKIAEQEAAAALTSIVQFKKLPKCPWETPSTWVDAKIVRKRKADDEAPMEPQAKRICLPWKVPATDKLPKPQRRPVRGATPPAINSTSKSVRSASPAMKASPSTVMKMENDELPREVSAADNVIVPQDPGVPSVTPTSANNAPSPTKQALSSSSAPNPSSSIETSAEGEGPQVKTKKTPRGNKASQTPQKGKGPATKLKNDKGKASATKTGRVNKPKDYRAEAKAKGGVRRSKRIKEMKKNLRCSEGCTKMHEHLY